MGEKKKNKQVFRNSNMTLNLRKKKNSRKNKKTKARIINEGKVTFSEF